LYFSTSCDAFQSPDVVQDATRGAMRAAFAAGSSVAFLTKGIIRSDIMDMLEAHREHVFAQVGVITVDDAVSSVVEPGAPPPAARIAQMADLIRRGIATTARVDPILPGITDTEDRLNLLFAAISGAGVEQVAVSYLFLRPKIRSNIVRVAVPMLTSMLNEYASGCKLTLHGESTMDSLPVGRRRSGYDTIVRIATTYGLKAIICHCKNADIEDSGACHIAGPPPISPISVSGNGRLRSASSSQKDDGGSKKARLM